jgi:hypothetical protein
MQAPHIRGGDGCFWRMPRFFFDLLGESDVVLDPGGMLFECPQRAATVADDLARARTGLRRGGWIRVRNHGGQEIHRSVIDPAPVADGR